jgi:beta-lactamase superfamily II metal-dependent hydrolase
MAPPGARSQATPLTAPPLVIRVLDIGQAEMAIVQTPDSQWIVLDAGLPQTDAAGIMLRKYDVRQIALAIGSHRHQDHIGGMPGLIAAVPVSRYIGDTARTDDRRISTTMLRRRLRQSRVPVQGPGADTLWVGAARVILLPQMPKDFNQENNNSIVVRLEYGRFSMLFPGDAENDEQQWLLRFYSELLGADVLEAAHHGSDNGISPGWLEATSPRAVVISAGVNGSYHHPQKEAVERYQVAAPGRVYCTNRHGTVEIQVWDDGSFRVDTEHKTNRSCTYDGTAYGE